MRLRHSINKEQGAVNPESKISLLLCISLETTTKTPMKYSHLILAGFLLAGTSLQTQTLYGSDVVLDSLGTIDSGTGAWTLIGSQGIPGFESINGMAYDSVNGILFGINTSTNDLVTMNTTSGLALVVGGTSGGQFNGLAYNPNSNVLYSVTTTDELYAINPNTGSSTFIGMGNIADQIEGLAFDPINDNLFGLNGQGQIYLINTVTGAASALPNGIGVGGLWRGLTWDNSNQRLLATTVGGGGGLLYTVNPATGLGVLVGATTNFAQGLAMTDGPPAAPFDYLVPVLTAGSNATFSYTGAVPFSAVYMLYSLNGAGPTNTIVGPLDMSSPIQVLSLVPADSIGMGSMTLFVPPGAAGLTLYTQAATLPLGQVSNSFATLVN